MAMELMQVRLPAGVIRQVNLMVKDGLYASKSDVIRDAIRKLILDKMVGSIPNTGDSVKEVRAIRKILSRMEPDLQGPKNS